MLLPFIILFSGWDSFFFSSRTHLIPFFSLGSFSSESIYNSFERDEPKRRRGRNLIPRSLLLLLLLLCVLWSNRTRIPHPLPSIPSGFWFSSSALNYYYIGRAVVQSSALSSSGPVVVLVCCSIFHNRKQFVITGTSKKFFILKKEKTGSVRSCRFFIFFSSACTVFPIQSATISVVSFSLSLEDGSTSTWSPSARHCASCFFFAWF